MKLSILPALVWVALAAGCSTTPAPDRDSIPEDILARRTCQEHVILEPKMTVEDFQAAAREGGETNAYVVISYDLDGSGKAAEPQVIYSHPKKVFDKTTLSLLSRTQFAPGVIRKSCTYVRTYAIRSMGRVEIPVDSGVKLDTPTEN